MTDFKSIDDQKNDQIKIYVGKILNIHSNDFAIGENVQALSERNLISVKVSGQFLLSTDTYSEIAIGRKITTMNEDEIAILCMCAIKIAVIGTGGGDYGQILIDNSPVKLSEIFKSKGVIVTGIKDIKLKQDDLTPRRLVRYFRYSIKDYIKENQIPSYLWKKYSDNNEEYKYVCYPGYEHILTNLDEASYLIKTYRKLDEIKSTKFVDRIKRVYQARGVSWQL